MLNSLRIVGFKSLAMKAPVELAPLTVLFGPNAVGKSNFIDAVQVFSRLASERTLADALSEPVRGRALETFSLPAGGLPALLEQERATFVLEATIERSTRRMLYKAEVAVSPRTGRLSVSDEFLAQLTGKRTVLGDPRLEVVDGQIRVRRRKRGKPLFEHLGQAFTQLSDRRFTGRDYDVIEQAREELSSWKAYYLDPRMAMRSARGPEEVSDIGPSGERIGPFLFRLKGQEPKAYDSVRRIFKTLVPSVQDLAVDVDPKRGVIDIDIIQRGTPFSARVASEGTLRVLALACVACNPWGGSLVAIEEPENGVHPRRIELIARMLLSLSTDEPGPRQVLVTSHSPVFCGAVSRLANEQPDSIALYRVGLSKGSTELVRFQPSGPLFQDVELREALTTPSEEQVFDALARRGLLDE
ncbi:MAG: ATP-binding protein [Candidatus Riflebacteria bacterium]|nr:ATP-binding protein [Candidatus Riflebacteria bacterium]